MYCIFICNIALLTEIWKKIWNSISFIMMICLQELRKINFMVHNICRITKYSLTFAILQEYLQNSNYVIPTVFIYKIYIGPRMHSTGVSKFSLFREFKVKWWFFLQIEWAAKEKMVVIYFEKKVHYKHLVLRKSIFKS